MFMNRKKLRRSHRHIPEGFHFLLEGQPHPLLIPSVIDEVASYLPLQDLKNFRGVCKSWNTEAVKYFKAISKVVVQDSDRLQEYSRIFLNNPLRFINYELKGDVELGSEVALKFFDNFGTPIQFIYINKVKWKDCELKNVLFKKLPNLKELAVEARAYSDRRLFINDSCDILPNIKVLKVNVFSFITDLSTPFLRDLLRACPNLEIISSLRTEKRNPLPMQFIQYVCQEMNYDTADDVVNMPYAADIAIAQSLVEPGAGTVTLKKLSAIDCNMRLRSQGLQQLAARNFPLKQLDLTILSDICSVGLRNFLNGLANTLQTLKIKFHPRCNASSSNPVPPLMNLRNLTLNGYRHSLKFLETLPELRTLTLVRLYFNKALTKESVLLPFVSKLQCLEVHEDFSLSCKKSSVEAVIKLFPGLKRLKLENLTDCALTCVFDNYQCLEELDATNGQYSDASITGIFGDELEKLRKDCAQGRYYDVTFANSLRCSSSIWCLKELRKLSLSSRRLTDISILYGIVECRGLRNLHLVSSRITDEAVERILEELDLFYFKLEYSYKISKEVIRYAMKKMSGRFVSINKYEGPLKQSEIPKFMRRNGSATVRVDKVSVEKKDEPLKLEDPIIQSASSNIENVPLK